MSFEILNPKLEKQLEPLMRVNPVAQSERIRVYSTSVSSRFVPENSRPSEGIHCRSHGRQYLQDVA